jgi:hypothetical protein
MHPLRKTHAEETGPATGVKFLWKDMEPTFAKKAKDAGIPIETVSSPLTDLCKIKIINRAIHVLEPVISALV